jgi:hypothetical protein
MRWFGGLLTTGSFTCRLPLGIQSFQRRQGLKSVCTDDGQRHPRLVDPDASGTPLQVRREEPFKVWIPYFMRVNTPSHKTSLSRETESKRDTLRRDMIHRHWPPLRALGQAKRPPFGPQVFHL